MPKGSPELTAARREEIIGACERLYQTMSFKEITLKEIGNATSLTRTSIYNYFLTKEEIFLALLQREYELWNEELDRIRNENEALSPRELAEKLACSLSGRNQFLKLLSMNHFDMEDNSRQEALASFKVTYGGSMRRIHSILEKFCPEMSQEEMQGLIYAFFPFMFGIYPYTTVTQKQREAMEAAGIPFVYQSVYELTYQFLARLLGV